MGMTPVYQRVIDLGPEMELRVKGLGGVGEAVRVAEHLTIGRSAASDFVIDDSKANLIHARVVPGIGGGHDLRCVGIARLVLEDGLAVDRITLTPGVRFWVGGTVVECVLVAPVGSPMTANVRPSEEKTKADKNVCPTEEEKDRQECLPHHKVGQECPAAEIEMPRLVVCPTCYFDMTGVPVVARFCPKCGVQLPARDSAGYLIPPEESSPLYPVYRALREDLEGKLSADATPQVASSLIILAYANAMLNLGWRYEHGQGALRNVAEAARCYAKAGRLSEAWGK
jgi:hypothetical protein